MKITGNHQLHQKHHSLRSVGEAIVDTVTLGGSSLLAAVPIAGGIWGASLASDASYIQDYKDRTTSGLLGLFIPIANWAGSLSLGAGLLLGNHSATVGGVAGLGLAAALMGALIVQVNHTAH